MPHLIPYDACGRAGKLRETCHKIRGPDIDVVGPTVVQEIPDHLRVSTSFAALSMGRNSTSRTARGGIFGEMPPKSVAHRRNRVMRELRIVACCMRIMPGRADEIEALSDRFSLTFAQAMCGAFEPSLGKRTETVSVGPDDGRSSTTS